METKFSREKLYEVSSKRFSEAFGKILQYLRKENNLTQKELANLLHVAPSTYANWEQGRRDPSIFDIFNIIWTLNIDANDLFNWEEIQNKISTLIVLETQHKSL